MRSSSFRSAAIVFAASLLVAQSAHAQVASAIIREGIAIPGGPPGETITSVQTVMANNAGGYAVRIDSTGSGTTLSHVWGSAGGGPGAVLRTEGAFSGYTQSAFESFFGVSNTGQVAYSPTLSVGDSVWLDATPVCVDPEPSTIPGLFWSFASRPLVSGLGTPYCIAGTSTTAGGSSSGYAFVKGVTATVLFRSGDTLPGMTGPIGPSGIDFDYAISAGDTHHITPVKATGVATTADDFIVYDGAVLSAGGSPIAEGVVVPASVGGVGGEAWALFDYVACNESGGYLITGDTSGPTTADEFVMVNGVFLHREGDVIDGATTINGIKAATMNEAGQVAFVWEIVGPSSNLDALFLDGELLLTEGDAVDLDGDGNIEPNSIVRAIGGTRELALTSTGEVLVTASIDTAGTTTTTDDVDAVFRISVAATPVVYCTAGTTTNGCVPSIAASASPSVTFANPCAISISSLEGQRLGLIFYSVAGPLAAPWGSGGSSFLCVKTPTQRSGTQSSGGTAGVCDGTFSLDWNAYQLANPGALGNPWTVGEQAWVQGWFRDPPAPKSTNLTDAVELTYVP